MILKNGDETTRVAIETLVINVTLAGEVKNFNDKLLFVMLLKTLDMNKRISLEKLRSIIHKQSGDIGLYVFGAGDIMFGYASNEKADADSVNMKS